MRRAVLMLVAGMGGLMASAALADPDDGYGYRVPNGNLPPPGECRVWLPDRPAGQQPPPTSCRQAECEADRYGGRVIYGGREGRDDYGRHEDDERYGDDRRGGRYGRYDDRRDERRYERGYGEVSERLAGLISSDPLLRDWAFSRYDGNRDGRLGPREADRANVGFYRLADVNRDGRVSEAEFRQARRIARQEFASR